MKNLKLLILIAGAIHIQAVTSATMDISKQIQGLPKKFQQDPAALDAYPIIRTNASAKQIEFKVVLNKKPKIEKTTSIIRTYYAPLEVVQSVDNLGNYSDLFESALYGVYYTNPYPVLTCTHDLVNNKYSCYIDYEYFIYPKELEHLTDYRLRRFKAEIDQKAKEFIDNPDLSLTLDQARKFTYSSRYNRLNQSASNFPTLQEKLNSELKIYPQTKFKVSESIKDHSLKSYESSAGKLFKKIAMAYLKQQKQRESMPTNAISK